MNWRELQEQDDLNPLPEDGWPEWLIWLMAFAVVLVLVVFSGAM